VETCFNCGSKNVVVTKQRLNNIEDMTVIICNDCGAYNTQVFKRKDKK